ncbi:MAG TPA: MBL fold metallo-hydrolase, partial [Tepidisphaeraceae bacterium]|nr:MBL fold metallo-hydrolase [Tepidisphaeraceae bacterium]
MAMHLLVGRRLWLIDTGIADTPAALTTYLQSIGRSWSDVAGAIITHPDADHSGGNGALRTLAPAALLIAHERDAYLIGNPDRCLTERYDFSHPYGSPLPDLIASRIRQNLGQGVPVDLRIHGDLRVQVDGRSFNIVHCPGHSAGHLIVHDPQARAAVITDAVLGEFIPDSQGRPLFAPTYRLLAEYRRTIQRLRALELDAMFPTHFPPLIGSAAVR